MIPLILSIIAIALGLASALLTFLSRHQRKQIKLDRDELLDAAQDLMTLTKFITSSPLIEWKNPAFYNALAATDKAIRKCEASK
jgi:hypothetical protein